MVHIIAILATTVALLPTSASAALTLNPIERALLGSRLDSIQSSVRAKFESETIPALFSPKGTGGSGISGGEGGDVDVGMRDVVLIFPGAGGADDLSAELEESFRSRDAEASLDVPRDVATFDWVEHRGSVATAAFDGEAVGEACAEALLSKGGAGATERKLRSVHSVGISVGAFAANAFARSICARLGEGERPYVRLTLLDPFTARGLSGPGYGSRTFGLDVDYAEQVLNTDDPVPTTNEPLPLCYCVDVTGAPEREDFVLPEGETMHCWPLAWYARHGGWWGEDAVKAGERGEKLRQKIGLPQHDERRMRGVVLSL
mmetsp:Transcript_46365/g.140434  ORF Transcript_46365/g.140434 Transcript_46365/m.140434 type:complete len:318 (-) Transcript_46365:430-1383(-)